MKKISLMASAILFSIAVSASEPLKTKKSASSSGGQCFDENSHVIGLGVSFGGVGYYKYGPGGSYTRTPNFNITYEQPWKDRIGPGFLGVGAYASFQSDNYRYNYISGYDGRAYFYEHHHNYITVAGRAAYHWDVLNKDKAEVYGGVIIGARLSLYAYETNDPNPNRDTYRIANSFAYPAWGVFAGARWYFVKNVALFAEVGHGISYGTAGVNFKF